MPSGTRLPKPSNATLLPAIHETLLSDACPSAHLPTLPALLSLTRCGPLTGGFHDKPEARPFHPLGRHPRRPSTLHDAGRHRPSGRYVHPLRHPQGCQPTAAFRSRRGQRRERFRHSRTDIVVTPRWRPAADCERTYFRSANATLCWPQRSTGGCSGSRRSPPPTAMRIAAAVAIVLLPSPSALPTYGTADHGCSPCRRFAPPQLPGCSGGASRSWACRWRCSVAPGRAQGLRPAADPRCIPRFRDRTPPLPA